mmetsp:Transcript_29980/g.54226  ORF Transcript_29980/g.54226 Transcript_29980/m.54226 type:complete len:220 (+) Transcript_29980:478-1137(+)
MMVFYLSLDLRNKLVENIEQMIGKLFLDLHVFVSTVSHRLVGPLLEIFIQAIRNENTVASSRKSRFPSCILCTRESNIDCRGPNLRWIGKILVKRIVQVVAIKVPHVVIGNAEVIGVSLDFAKEKDVAMALANRPLLGILELFHYRQVLWKHLVVEIVHRCSTNDILGANLCGGDTVLVPCSCKCRGIADAYTNRTSILNNYFTDRCIHQDLTTKASDG